MRKMRQSLVGLVWILVVCTGCGGTHGGSTPNPAPDAGSSSAHLGSSEHSSGRRSSSTAPSVSSSSVGATSPFQQGSSSNAESQGSSWPSSQALSSSNGHTSSGPSSAGSSAAAASSQGASTSRNFLAGASGEPVLRPGPCTTTLESPPDQPAARTTYSYVDGRLCAEFQDVDLDGRWETSKTYTYLPSGALDRVLEDVSGDGLPDVEELYGYSNSGQHNQTVRQSVANGRVLGVTTLTYDAQGRLWTTAVDDYNDGTVDLTVTLSYGATGLVALEHMVAGLNAQDCTFDRAPLGLETRTCRDTANQRIVRVETRLRDDLGNLLGMVVDVNGDGVVDEVVRRNYSCFQGGSSSGSSGVASSSLSASGAGSSASTASGGSSSAAATSSAGNPCAVWEVQPTAWDAPQLIPQTCSTWDLWGGSLSPLGDQDHFAVHLAAGQSVLASTWVGMPGACGTADTVLDLFTQGSVPPPTEAYCGLAWGALACDDDSGPGACSSLAYTSLTGGDLVLRVSALANASVVEGYGMHVEVVTPGCGNGRVEAGEACDDGNTVAGDGCSATCTLEGDTCAAPIAVTLFPQPTVFTLSTVGQAANVTASCVTTSAAAPDTIFSFMAPAAGTFTAVLQGLDGFDGVLQLVRGTCGAGATGLMCRNATQSGDTEVLQTGVTAGTPYWLYVDGVGAAPGRYKLSLSFTPAVCGNGVVELPEECDDGNIVGGDGCAANCMSECNVTGGPDSTFAAPLGIPANCTVFTYLNGSISGAGDWDHFRVALRAGQHVIPKLFRATTVDCPSGVWDMVVQLRLAPLTGDPVAASCSGAEAGRLACNDAAAGCDTFNFTVTQTGDYVISVADYNANETVPQYGLQVTIQ